MASSAGAAAHYVGDAGSGRKSRPKPPNLSSSSAAASPRRMESHGDAPDTGIASSPESSPPSAAVRSDPVAVYSNGRARNSYTASYRANNGRAAPSAAECTPSSKRACHYRPRKKSVAPAAEMSEPN